MTRSLLCTIMAAALGSAASLWAAPTVAAAPNQFVDQIANQTHQIQAEADSLQRYVRSGARDLNIYAYADNMGNSLRKLNSAVNALAERPGLTAQARQQADNIKIDLAELTATFADTVKQINPNELPLHASAVFADTNFIESRGSMLRSAAENLAGTR